MKENYNKSLFYFYYAQNTFIFAFKIPQNKMDNLKLKIKSIAINEHVRYVISIQYL